MEEYIGTFEYSARLKRCDTGLNRPIGIVVSDSYIKPFINIGDASSHSERRNTKC